MSTALLYSFNAKYFLFCIQHSVYHNSSRNTVSCTLCCVSCFLCHVPYVLCHMLYALYIMSYAPSSMSYVICHMSCALYPVSCIICTMPLILCPMSCTRCPVKSAYYFMLQSHHSTSTGTDCLAWLFQNAYYRPSMCL